MTKKTPPTQGGAATKTAPGSNGSAPHKKTAKAAPSKPAQPLGAPADNLSEWPEPVSAAQRSSQGKTQPAPKGSAKKSPKKAAKKATPVKPTVTPMVAAEPVVVYEAVEVLAKFGEDPLTIADAKEMLGWQEESETSQFGSDYHLKDLFNRKVRLMHNVTNRPRNAQLAKEWMMEHLRGKWRFNGETIIVDKYGMVQDGQHRLTGLVLAGQAVEKEPARWPHWLDRAPVMETLVVVGIDPSDDVVNTIGVGKPRSLADVVYRSELFADVADKERIKVARVAASAVKLLWRRTKQDMTAYSPSRSHSESLDFIQRHPKLLEAVRHIWEEDDHGKGKLAKYVFPGMASGLLYLMGSARSDWDTYVEAENESALNWDLWDMACDFWVDLAAGGALTKELREVMPTIESSGQVGQDEVAGTVIKAWLLYSDKEPITADAITCLMTTDDVGRPILAERPRIGGIDMMDPLGAVGGEEDAE